MQITVSARLLHLLRFSCYPDTIYVYSAAAGGMMRIKFCAKWMAAVVVACSAAVAPAFAGQIGIGDFSGGETVTTFDGLGLDFFNPTPIAIDGNTYVTDSGFLRYFPPFPLCSGSCIGNDTEPGFIDVTLGGPATRAGARVGINGTWSGTVEFYDLVNALLGTVTFTDESAGLQFAGWESAGGIGRMRLVDGSPDNFSVIIMDDFRFENVNVQVPEPSSMALFGLGGLLLFASTRRRGKV